MEHDSSTVNSPREEILRKLNASGKKVDTRDILERIKKLDEDLVNGTQIFSFSAQKNRRSECAGITPFRNRNGRNLQQGLIRSNLNSKFGCFDEDKQILDEKENISSVVNQRVHGSTATQSRTKNCASGNPVITAISRPGNGTIKRVQEVERAESKSVSPKSEFIESNTGAEQKPSSLEVPSQNTPPRLYSTQRKINEILSRKSESHCEQRTPVYAAPTYNRLESKVRGADARDKEISKIEKTKLKRNTLSTEHFEAEFATRKLQSPRTPSRSGKICERSFVESLMYHSRAEAKLETPEEKSSESKDIKEAKRETSDDFHSNVLPKKTLVELFKENDVRPEKLKTAKRSSFNFGSFLKTKVDSSSKKEGVKSVTPRRFIPKFLRRSGTVQR